MAMPMEKPILKEEGHRQDYEETSSATGCGCFRLFGFKRLRINENEEEQGKRQACKETTWWVKKMKEAKELSEVFAGPKWKTFVRKVGGYCKGRKQNKARCQYDPQSYALNFDSRADREQDDPLLDFSSRFTAPMATENRKL